MTISPQIIQLYRTRDSTIIRQNFQQILPGTNTFRFRVAGNAAKLVGPICYSIAHVSATLRGTWCSIYDMHERVPRNERSRCVPTNDHCETRSFVHPDAFRVVSRTIEWCRRTSATIVIARRYGRLRDLNHEGDYSTTARANYFFLGNNNGAVAVNRRFSYYSPVF
jgi:hypothetical protein